MTRDYLHLPERPAKPRPSGVTMAIDNGTPSGYFDDVVTSAGEFVDFVKFGWGTSVISKDVKSKIEALRREDVEFYFGGTLFEKYVMQERFDEFRWMCHEYGCTYVEVSNGTINLSDARKSEFVSVLAKDFHVISEVGSKHQDKSDVQTAAEWIGCINDDLEAGAVRVTLETRESGQGGICQSNGQLRRDLLDQILESGIDVNCLLFEAPTTALQNYFVNRIGPNVNVGNIHLGDLIGLETIRLGLRSETLTAFESADVRHRHEVG